MGFSQGAMMALFTGLRRSPPPAVILAYSGRLIGAETLAAEIRGRPPVLLVHGEEDEVVPAAASRDAESVLEAAGVPASAVFRAGLGHGIDEVGMTVGALSLQQHLGTVA
jgi:phospholipase/carboxylesterase